MNDKKLGGAGEKLFDATGALLGLYLTVLCFGIKRIRWTDPHFWWWCLCATAVIFGAARNHGFALALDPLLPETVTEGFLEWALKIPWDAWFWFFWASATVLGIPAFGVGEFARRRRYQRRLDILALKSGSGLRPKVVGVEGIDGHRTRLTVESPGVGADRYRAKEDDLASAFGETLEGIGPCGGPGKVALVLTKSTLPKRADFGDAPEAKAPLGFCVGKSLGGWISASLADLPHMLIAGTTGGGKSVFFKQVLLSVLKNTPNVQLYLIDLKKGVEMGSFERLPNVGVAKTEREAVALLEALKNEMDRRFVLLEKTGKKDVALLGEPPDRIVVGIDEASVLYSKTKSKAKGELMERARELTDDLAKLSRAAGMHLILATQKVTKETIDTKVQENIGGRMCFKTATLQGSMTVLGNKGAMGLPDTKGRGIWARGNRFTEVQAPFLSEEEFEEQIGALAHEYGTGGRVPQGPMLRGIPRKTKKRLANMNEEADA